MGGQFDLRLLAWGLRDFEGNVRMYVRVFCASAALEVPLKQERGVGGGRVDLSLQRGGCDVAVENTGFC